MKQYYFLFFLFFSVTISSAQDVIVDDNFDVDNRNWTYSGDGFEVYLKKGKLILENNTTAKTKWQLIKIDESTDQIDFDVEATIKVLSTEKDNATFGLVWSGYNDNSYYDVVQMTSDKRLQLYQYQKNKFDNYKKWYTEKALNTKKNENKVKVEKRANIITVYINGELVFKDGNRDYYGSKFGFILDANVKIEVDDFKITKYTKNIKVVESFDPNLKIKKLPEFISSPKYEESNPVISADGKTLYVDRKNADINIGGSKDDVWFSVKDENNEWTPLKNIGHPINNPDHNFVISVSPDNNTLLVGNKYKADGSGSSGAGLSIANRTADGWSIPQEMIIKEYSNTNKYVSYFLASDNKHLLMALERPEGLGQKDIYVSFLESENNWSVPMHLGNVVNTFDDEANAFLASDGKTLYFASRGHQGYGGYDLFVSKRLDDTWKNWSEPKNLGNVINTPNTELSIFLSAKGDKAYVGRSKDIWEIDNTVKQDPVVLIKGKVYDAKTNQTISAPIVYNNLKTNNELGKAISDPTTGSYSIVLPFGEKYSFMAEKLGYYAVTENVDLSSLNEYKEITVNLYLNPIEKGQTIRLNNIFFDSGKHELLEESYAELNKLFNVLNESQKIQIEIAGHTDAVGSDTNNMVLSNNRANAVMQYLLTKGIQKERLTAKGYGETKFIATNETEEGKQQNRRVEFIILEL